MRVLRNLRDELLSTIPEGTIGLIFNDKFGYEFAQNGVPCVQIHTPSRHIAHTRL